MQLAKPPAVVLLLLLIPITGCQQVQLPHHRSVRDIGRLLRATVVFPA